MGTLNDLSGERFGRWTVRDRAPSRGHHTYWHCVCDCGGVGVVAATNLTAGRSRSCGCLRREVNAEAVRRTKPWRHLHEPESLCECGADVAVVDGERWCVRSGAVLERFACDPDKRLASAADLAELRRAVAWRASELDRQVDRECLGEEVE